MTNTTRLDQIPLARHDQLRLPEPKHITPRDRIDDQLARADQLGLDVRDFFKTDDHATQLSRWIDGAASRAVAEASRAAAAAGPRAFVREVLAADPGRRKEMIQEIESHELIAMLKQLPRNEREPIIKLCGEFFHGEAVLRASLASDDEVRLWVRVKVAGGASGYFEIAHRELTAAHVRKLEKAGIPEYARAPKYNVYPNAEPHTTGGILEGTSTWTRESFAALREVCPDVEAAVQSGAIVVEDLPIGECRARMQGLYASGTFEQLP